MPPRARGHARGRNTRGRNARGRGGHNNHGEESDVEVEHSHHDGGNSGNNDGHDGQETTLKNWLELKAGDFHGNGTPMDASSWLSTMEKYMAAMELPSHKRVLFVAFNLKGLADAWWTGVRDAYVPVHGEPTWAVFVQQFTDKYYPQSFKDEMSEKLKNIKQEKLSVDEYEAEFSKMVLFVDRVRHDEAEKARAFFRGLNSRYREVMGARPPNDYMSMVQQARGMELEVRLTAMEDGRTGGSSGTGGDHKGNNRGGSGSTQRPPFKKFKGNHRPQQTTKFKQSGLQSSSMPRSSSASTPLRPVPGQGMICFKCGEGHRASECTWTGECHHCGRHGHKGRVCRENPACIIKWETTPATPTAGPTRGSVHMLAAAPTSTPQYPPAWAPPSGYVWQAVPLVSAQYPTPSAPLQLSAPPQHSVGTPSAPPQPGVYAMPTSASLRRPDVITGVGTSGSESYNSQFVPRG
ncbi:uncharacterized protein [Lolium perenne]|uniref:uncharacterized protein isoform X1 n=1 Tax=Lolium perenne TaxID=4522 RepID=UPI003A99A45C